MLSLLLFTTSSASIIDSCQKEVKTFCKDGFSRFQNINLLCSNLLEREDLSGLGHNGKVI